MKLLWQKFRDLPPKRQVWFWLALLIVVIPLYLRVYGFTLTSPEERFRRQEEAEFLGPMEILGSFETDGPIFRRGIIAADEHTAAVFLYNGHDEVFLRREREGDFTLLPGVWLSSDWYITEEETFTLPAILFDRHPKAVRAELDIDIGEQSWALSAVRDGSGWFRFDLVRSEEPGQAEIQALVLLYEHLFSGRDAEVSFTARFYGAAGDLIAESFREPQ